MTRREVSATEVSPPTVTQLTSLKQERQEANRAHVFMCRWALGPAIVPVWLTVGGGLLGCLCLLKEAMHSGLLQWCKKIPLWTLEWWSLTCCFSLSVSFFLHTKNTLTAVTFGASGSSPKILPSSPFSSFSFPCVFSKLKGFNWQRWVTAFKTIIKHVQQNRHKKNSF